MLAVYRIVSLALTTLFEASNQWTDDERKRYRRLLARLHDRVITALMQSTLASGQLVSIYGRSRMTALVDYAAGRVTISIVKVDFYGGDGSGPGGGLDALAFEDYNIIAEAEIVREGRTWSFKQRSGEPVRLPGTRHHHDGQVSMSADQAGMDSTQAALDARVDNNNPIDAAINSTANEIIIVLIQKQIRADIFVAKHPTPPGFTPTFVQIHAIGPRFDEYIFRDPMTISLWQHNDTRAIISRGDSAAPGIGSCRPGEDSNFSSGSISMQRADVFDRRQTTGVRLKFTKTKPDDSEDCRA